MSKSSVRKLFLHLFTLLNLQLLFFCGYSQPSPDNQMQAHFINVGQADAALFEFPCGAVLIDAGAQDTLSKQALIQYLHNFFARRTDSVCLLS
jgi:beta-lactamase superfamily II metal-dependent hydrolase